MSSTVRDALTDATTDMGDRAERVVRDAIDHADEQWREFKAATFDHIETGTWIVSGAILAGLVLAALIIRTTPGS